MTTKNNPRARWLRLVETFPALPRSLRRAGVELYASGSFDTVFDALWEATGPYDGDDDDAAGYGVDLSGGAHHAARFALMVWTGDGAYFDLPRALGAWDSEHRAAFQAWAADPWWG